MLSIPASRAMQILVRLYRGIAPGNLRRVSGAPETSLIPQAPNLPLGRLKIRAAGHLACAALVCLILFVAYGGRADGATRAAFATDHILVCFKPEARAALPAALRREQSSALVAKLNLPNGAELREPELTRLRRHKKIAPDAIDLESFFYLGLPPGLSVTDCVRRLQGHPLIDYAEPDWIGTTAETIPSDPNYPNQWHHKNSAKPSASLQTPQAWDISQGSSAVLVAVLDTGLADLPEFAERTVPGYNFAYTNSNTIDDNGHGTEVAGVLAANANNEMFGAGVDWRCRIMPIKVFDSNNMGFYSSWAQGIDFAVSNGCKIINLSGGGTEFGRTVQRAITNAIAHGVIFVTAAGNLGDTNLSFPGYLRECITVGATDREDRRAPFSNSGPQLDLVAPGMDIVTVGRLGELALASGTSFSAPMAAGVCSLLAALRPDLTQADARLLLCAGAEDQVGDAADTPGFDTHYGWGRLNAFNSLLLATTRLESPQLIDGRIEFLWRSPLNASNKQPYVVEYKTSLTDAWIPLLDTNVFRYATNHTYWTNDTTQSGMRIYRVALQQF